VLDRWHLLRNWGEVMQKTLGQQVEFLQQASQQIKRETPSTSGKKTDKPRKAGRRTPPPPPSPRSIWQAQMHQQVHALAAQGKMPSEIRESLHLCEQTVRKYLRMPTFAAHYRGRISPVEPYRAYLETRWQQGEVMVKRLWEELQMQGFQGTYRSVWSFVHRWPLPVGMTPAAASPPSSPHRWSAGTRSPRQVRWLLLRKR
jgi:transposase